MKGRTCRYQHVVVFTYLTHEAFNSSIAITLLVHQAQVCFDASFVYYVITFLSGSKRLLSFRPADIPEILWFEEETDLIRSCAALSSALGLQKSFSTSDITQLPSPDDTPILPAFRCAVSELALNSLQRSGFLLEHARLDHTSRSCSTWVAVGDVASTSQLPSPHGGHSNSNTTAAAPASTPPPPTFTAADFIRSVNKKVGISKADKMFF